MLEVMPSHQDILRINLGCGPVQPDGWINVDGSNRAWLASHLPWVDALFVKAGVFPRTEFNGRTTFMDLRKGLRLPNESASCVYAGELWEHLEPPDGAKLAAECFRVLQAGGVLRICVPDGRAFWGEYIRIHDSLAALPAAARDPRPLAKHVSMFFGDICTRRPWFGSMGHFHKWQYDEVQLGEMLARAGFVEVQRRAFHDSRIPGISHVERSSFLIMECVKP
jgi:predicted SAM-dependent methyltransferase